MLFDFLEVVYNPNSLNGASKRIRDNKQFLKSFVEYYWNDGCRTLNMYLKRSERSHNYVHSELDKELLAKTWEEKRKSKD